MKSFLKSVTFFLVIVSFGFIFPTNVLAQQTRPDISVTNQNLRTIELEVGGMTCQKGCADGIDEKLKTVDGVIRSKTKLETGMSKITYDDTKVTLLNLISIIEGRGYTAKLSSKSK